MKNIISFAVLFLVLTACNSLGQKVNNLSANEFEKQISTSKVQLIDVRTPEEFAERHIAGAVNININSNNFEAELKKYSKDQPIYFYCLSGGRSARAAQTAAASGFKTTYNLEGGILSWANAGKPVETTTTHKKSQGLTQQAYLTLINKEKMVLVDFNAVWCGPCKILKPRVKNVVKKHAEKVELLDIDVDKNAELANYMNISAIPLLILYKQGKEVWRKMGLAEESEIAAAIQNVK